jgi:hypothetical protein
MDETYEVGGTYESMASWEEDGMGIEYGSEED